MSSQATLAKDALPDAAPRSIEAVARPALERQLAGLDRLAEIGLVIAERLGRLAAEVPSPQDDATPAGAEAANDAGAAAFDPPHFHPNDIALAFGRVSRAVRLTYALQNQVIEQLRRVAGIEEADARIAARERAEQAQARRASVGRVLTRIIEDEVYGPANADADGETDMDAAADLSGERERETYERLIGEAAECLQDRERFGDLMGRPLSDTIAHLCRELGVSPDWLSLSEEAWARDEIRSGAVGKALAHFSSPARGGGGPAQPVEGARPTHAAPSVTALPRRASSPARGGGEASASP